MVEDIIEQPMRPRNEVIEEWEIRERWRVRYWKTCTKYEYFFQHLFGEVERQRSSHSDRFIGCHRRMEIQTVYYSICTLLIKVSLFGVPTLPFRSMQRLSNLFAAKLPSKSIRALISRFTFTSAVPYERPCIGLENEIPFKYTR